MDSGLKTLIETWVMGCGPYFVGTVVPCAKVAESNDQEAWSDFHGSRLAFKKSFQNCQWGSL
jgi:hypothetical protein